MSKEDKNSFPEFEQEVLEFVLPKEEPVPKVVKEVETKKRKRDEFEKA